MHSPPSHTSRADPLAWLSIFQGVYYVAAGVWPLLSDVTFQAVTGPKRDVWLVKTVGVLVAVMGGVLIMAGWRRAITREVYALGVGAACGLTAIDVVYVAAERIPPVYLLDAAAEVAVILLWVLLWLRSRQAKERSEWRLRNSETGSGEPSVGRHWPAAPPPSTGA
ncbi:MAG TPA: hypothetical protein VN428_17785 [Bryobacteraceae bacterium]|nr:hypothetical protein [Bryobacteraceae bacterium]